MVLLTGAQPTSTASSSSESSPSPSSAPRRVAFGITGFRIRHADVPMETSDPERDQRLRFQPPAGPIPGDTELRIIRSEDLPIVNLERPALSGAAALEAALSLMRGQPLHPGMTRASLPVFAPEMETLWDAFTTFLAQDAGSLERMRNLHRVHDFLAHFVHPAIRHVVSTQATHHAEIHSLVRYAEEACGSQARLATRLETAFSDVRTVVLRNQDLSLQAHSRLDHLVGQLNTMLT